MSSELIKGVCLVFFLCRDELGRFVADKRCLTSLKMEGCSNLGGFVLCSSSLSMLWLSDLYSVSKMVIIPFLSVYLLAFSCLIYFSNLLNLGESLLHASVSFV